MPRLSIPAQYRIGLSKIESLDDTAFGELASALQDFKSVKIDPAAMARISSTMPHVPAEDVDLFLETLLSLNAVRTGNQKSNEQFADDVLRELAEAGLLKSAGNESSERQKFLIRLKTLFGLESLAVVAKARDLQVEHGHVFLNGRIMTDLRPVFRGLPDEEPLGMVVFHTLKLSYIDREKNGDRSTFYLALDDNDVAALSRLLQRAESKAKTLRSKLGSVGINCLDEEQR